MPQAILSIDMSDLKELIRDFTVAPARMEHDVQEEVNKVGLMAWKIARDKAPEFQGHLRAGITFDPPLVRVGLGGGTGTVIIRSSIQTTTPPYDDVQEEGRTAGATPPPIDAMMHWIDMKSRRGQFVVPTRAGEPPLRAIRRAAYFLSRSIGRKGTPAHRFMRQAEEFASVEIFRRIQILLDVWEHKFDRGWK